MPEEKELEPLSLKKNYGYYTLTACIISNKIIFTLLNPDGEEVCHTKIGCVNEENAQKAWADADFDLLDAVYELMAGAE